MIQRQLSNGTLWSDETGEREQMFVELAARHNRISTDEVYDRMSSGKPVRYDTDWYEMIRLPVGYVKNTPQLVKCDCGHAVAAELVMSTGAGSSCPDCYDRMS